MTDSPTGRTLVMIPTYNEAENIERLLGEVLALPVPLDVLVVDDNSPDGTGALVDAYAARDARVKVLHRPGKLGLGTAYIAAFRYAMDHGYTYGLGMDADFSHKPRYIPELVALMDDHDLAVGSRYVTGGGTTGWPFHRALLSRGANAFAKLMLGLRVHDCTGAFRCYRLSTLSEIGPETIFSSGYSMQIEAITQFVRRGARIVEIPIIFDNRRLGSSKISRAEILKAMYTVLRLRLTRA